MAADGDLTFFAVEIPVFRTGSDIVSLSQGAGTHPSGTLSQFSDMLQTDTTILASDIGYRTTSGAPRVYPPRITGAFQIDQRINLDPTQSAVGASWGQLSLSNIDGAYDSIAETTTSFGQLVSIYYGSKSYDAARGIMVDPPYGSLKPVAVLAPEPWLLTYKELQIPLRDATYLTEFPLQSQIYSGTGSYEGTAALQGKPKPMARGGTASAPIYNISPVLIDPAQLIYQYTDGPGTVVRAYEGGAAVWTSDGDVSSLYGGSVPAGHYRTDNSRGLFQLGSQPVGTVTADVTGAFPSGATISQAALIALALLQEDLAVAPGALDADSFHAAISSVLPPFVASEGAGTRPCGTLSQLEGSNTLATATDPAQGVAGVWWSSDSTVDGPGALDQIVRSFGGQVISDRSGRLRLVLLRDLTASDSPVIQLDPTNIVALDRQPLPATVQPPCYRVRVGYATNHTILTSGLSPQVSAERIQYLQSTGGNATFISDQVMRDWVRPTDLGPLQSVMLQLGDAQAVADILGSLWSVRRGFYAATVPTSLALTLSIGDVVSLVWPTGNLNSGKLAQIVGETWKSSDPTITFYLLVSEVSAAPTAVAIAAALAAYDVTSYGDGSVYADHSLGLISGQPISASDILGIVNEAQAAISLLAEMATQWNALAAQISDLQQQAAAVPVTSPDNTWISAVGAWLFDSETPPVKWDLVATQAGTSVRVAGVIDAATAGTTLLGWKSSAMYRQTGASWFSSPPVYPAVWSSSTDPRITTTPQTWGSHKNTHITLSGSNLIATATANGVDQVVSSALTYSSGKWYWEVLLTYTADGGAGVATTQVPIGDGQWLGSTDNGIGWYHDGAIFTNNAYQTSWSPFTSVARLCFALDLNNNKLWGRVGTTGDWNASAITNQNPATNTGGFSLSTGTMLSFPMGPAANLKSTAIPDSITGVFASGSFVGAPPSGFAPFVS
jgi:hypothetical protein